MSILKGPCTISIDKRPNMFILLKIERSRAKNNPHFENTWKKKIWFEARWSKFIIGYKQILKIDIIDLNLFLKILGTLIPLSQQENRLKSWPTNMLLAQISFYFEWINNWWINGRGFIRTLGLKTLSFIQISR
jgi:hypothetical protein